MKKVFINNIKPGDSINDVFVLSDKNMAQKKDRNNFLNITLSDRTGTVKGVVWDNVDHIQNTVTKGSIVYVKGNASEYNGNLQIVVKKMEPQSVESINPANFLPTTEHDIENMYARLLKIIDSIESSYFKELLYGFFNDNRFAEKFKTAPAAKKMHHAYLGGLLEHSLSTAVLAKKVAGHYSGIDTDMLVTGAILHDIGKVDEFIYNFSINYSDEGRLLNHITIGIEMIDEKIRQTKDFPKKEALLLKHLIVSHHGAREFGSPEPPKTIEAVLLNYIDEIDSKIKGIRNFMSKNDPNETWTSFHKLYARHFYKGTDHKKE